MVDENTENVFYRERELVLRITLDLFLSHLGFFMGILTTVGIWIFTENVTPRIFFQEIFSKVWLANVPVLTVCCLFAYVVTGLYGKRTLDTPYLGRMLAVIKSVLTAFCFISVVDLHHKNLYAPKYDDCGVAFYLFSDLIQPIDLGLFFPTVSPCAHYL